MALNGIQIFKLTPKKNCKECGCPTCMAFSMKVAQGAMKIEQCPHMSEDALASLSEATAPPMKTIKIGTGDGEFTLGGETVLFRHEKTFVSKTRYAVSLCTCMSDEEVEAKVIFMLAVDDPKKHLELLQNVLAVLQDKDVLNKLSNADKCSETAYAGMNGLIFQANFYTLKLHPSGLHRPDLHQFRRFRFPGRRS